MTAEIAKREPADVEEIPWTSFYDMHSGGYRKEDYELIYIQAPEDEAVMVFYERFDRYPENITCSCCGEDYAVSQIEENPVTDLEGYLQFGGHKDVLIISADMI